jgi:hypothetical protein
MTSSSCGMTRSTSALAKKKASGRRRIRSRQSTRPSAIPVGWLATISAAPVVGTCDEPVTDAARDEAGSGLHHRLGRRGGRARSASATVMAEEAVEHGTGERAGIGVRAASQGARSAISGSMRSAMVMDMARSNHVEGNGLMTRARAWETGGKLLRNDHDRDRVP